MERVSKQNYYLDIAQTVAERSTCLRRMFGAIIAAPREQMLGATLYMVCVDAKTHEVQSGTSSCMMCKRLVLNAGIKTVVVRDTADTYREIDVASWITDDDSLSGIFGY